MMDRRSPLILLGAGASVDAGIPTATDMTVEMLKRFERQGRPDTKTAQVIQFVGGGIQMMRGIKGKNPLVGINIEDLFAAVEMLADRHNLDITPFVAQWHSAIDEIDEIVIDHSEFREIESVIRDIVNTPTPQDALYYSQTGRSEGRRFSNALQRLVTDITSTPTGDTFYNASRRMIAALVDIVWINDGSKVEYLYDMVRAANDENLTIVTLNYDNAIEMAAASTGGKINAGLEYWSEHGTFAKPHDGIELLKLHGSVDWKQIEKHRVISDENTIFPISTIQQISPTELDEKKRAFSYRPAVIFGAGKKLTASGPFLELFRTFGHRLDKHQELLVIGYSFRDPHINQVIYRWMNNSAHRNMVIVDHPKVEKNEHELWRKYQMNIPDDRITFVNIGAAAGIAEYFEGSS